MISLLVLIALQSQPATVIPTHSLDELFERMSRGSDTTYVVNFWATWCKPCVTELPAFDKVGRADHAKPVKVVLVSLDDPKTKEKVDEFVKRRGFVSEVVILSDQKPHEWIDRISEDWSGSIPATLLVNTHANKREFFEQPFTYEQLTSVLAQFQANIP